MCQGLTCGGICSEAKLQVVCKNPVCGFWRQLQVQHLLEFRGADSECL